MQAGDRIGPYVVESHLGSGQMGIVFAVRRPELDARYALKVLRRELCAARDLLRFQREIELLAAVSKHPHVVPIHTAGEDRCGLYYVMDLVEGPTLQELLARGGAMSPERATRYVCGVAGALTALHRAGIVHRDIKPSNVLVDARDSARLADFGLARVFADEKGRLTNTGELVGTPHFMAPEQALGLPVGPPADVYALGMVLFTLLAGRPAVEGTGLLEVLTRVGSGELVALPKLAPDTPEALLSVISRCLETDAKARPSAEEVVAAMESFLQTPAAPRVARRTSPAMVGLTVVAGVSVLGGLLALASARRASPTVDAAPARALAVAPVSTSAPAPPKARPLVRLVGGGAEELRQVLAGVDALGVAAISEEQRRALGEAVQRLDRLWTDPLGGTLEVGADRVDVTADAVERLVLIHALLRRLDPTHRLPQSRRGCASALVFGQLGLHLQRLTPAFFAELVALMPDDVNAYMVYCDATRDTWRHKESIDLDLLRRGIVVARETGQEAAWGRMVHLLSIYLWMKAGTSARAEAVAELEALVADAEATAWSNRDMTEAMLYLNQVLIHVARFDEALAVTRRARERSPTEPDPIGRSVITRAQRAAVLGAPGDDAWLEEALAEAEDYFALKARVEVKNEHVTQALIVALCGALEARGRTAVAAALCARALVVHGETQPMPAVACRRVLHLCRLEAPAPALAEALDLAAKRLQGLATAVASMRGADPEALKARFAAAEEAGALAAGVRDGSIVHAQVAKRLIAACRAGQLGFDLQPVAPPR